MIQNSPSADSEQTPPVEETRVAVAAPANKPIVSYGILGVTIAVFVLQLVSESMFGVDLPAAYGMKINAAILAGQYWRLFTPMLLHGSILHIASNMYALYMFGPSLERHFGHARFLALYVLAGLAGNVASYLMTPNPSLGASTAVFGLVAAEAVFVYRNRFLFGKMARPIIMNSLVVIGINLALGLQPRIDNWGHMGGMIGGLLFTWLAGPIFKVAGEYPHFRLVDTTPRRNTWLVSAGLTLFLLLLAGALIGLQLEPIIK